MPLAGMPPATQNFGGTGATSNKPVLKEAPLKELWSFRPQTEAGSIVDALVVLEGGFLLQTV